ncbi:hypothetical protein HPB49_020183 [Dermacentor silvarum]|uniref:Uncharacterized protein n=1 Tax=Dermacentor silvarum TaxID=543639 RepID=A0ACB8C579_DERSI|nr:hypothetical protein HPB49_020183 [Dermacentor silvarum]
MPTKLQLSTRRRGSSMGSHSRRPPQQIHNKIVTARKPTALAAKRIASTTTVIIAFDGPDVPFQVRYGSTLLPCSLYRKQIYMCYQCGRLGHRMDVCPYPNNKICRGCGARNPPADHNCNPRCSLCGGPHLTADKSCAARYKTPYVIRKRIGERRATSQASYQQAGPSTLNTRTRSRSRTLSRGSRSRSRTPSRSRQQRSRSRSASASRIPSTNKNKVSFAEALKGTSREGRKITNTHAPSPPPSPDNPEIAHLKRENVILRDLLTKLTQEVRDLKQSQTPAPTPIAQNAPAPSQEAPTTPAPKKRALQDGAMGHVRSEVKDMLTSLQTTVSTFQHALDSIQHALIEQPKLQTEASAKVRPPKSRVQLPKLHTDVVVPRQLFLENNKAIADTGSHITTRTEDKFEITKNEMRKPFSLERGDQNSKSQPNRHHSYYFHDRHRSVETDHQRRSTARNRSHEYN